MVFLYGSSYGYNYGKLEGLLPGCRFGSTVDKRIDHDEGIKLVIFDGEVIGTIIVNVDGITLGLDVGIELVSLDVSFDGCNDGNIEGLFPEESLVFTDGKVLGFCEGIKVILFDGKLIGNFIRNLDRFTLGFDVERDLGYLDGSFDGSNDGKLEGFLLEDLVGSTDDKVLVFDEGIKLVYTDSTVLALYL